MNIYTKWLFSPGTDVDIEPNRNGELKNGIDMDETCRSSDQGAKPF
jgi:hypothetical protein